MRLRAALGLLISAVLAGAALAESPVESPRPQPRLSTMGGATIVTPLHLRRPLPRPGSTATEVVSSDAALPGKRPLSRPVQARRPAEIVQIAAAARSLAATPRPPVRPDNLRRRATLAAAGVRSQPVPEATTGRKGSVCGDPAIRGSTIPPIAAKLKGCGLTEGVMVTSVDGVALSTPATIDCATAKALKNWVTTGVKPAVGKLGGGVARLQVAAHYACRPRNNQAGEKVSEHGRGRAIDISAIVLKNEIAISVLKGWTDQQHGRILKAAHKAACGPFGTVLGPAANAYHRDHLHLDTARYRSGSFCR